MLNVPDSVALEAEAQTLGSLPDEQLIPRLAQLRVLYKANPALFTPLTRQPPTLRK
jgi:hypothetical protein